MYGRPMAIVMADLALGARRRGSGCLDEQVDRRRASQHLDEFSAEAASNPQAKRALVELDRLPEIIDVDIDEELHTLVRDDSICLRAEGATMTGRNLSLILTLASA